MMNTALMDSVYGGEAGRRMSQSLAEIVRSKRLSLGLTQEDLEEASGISQTHLSQIETGKTRMPQVDTLEALARSLTLELNDLMIAAGYPVVHQASASGKITFSGQATAVVIPGRQSLLRKFDDPTFLTALRGAGVSDEDIAGLRIALSSLPDES